MYMYIYIYIYICVYMYIYIYMYVCVYIYTQFCLLLYMSVKFSLLHLRKYISSWRSTSRCQGNFCVLDGAVRWGKAEMARRSAA